MSWTTETLEGLWDMHSAMHYGAKPWNRTMEGAVHRMAGKILSAGSKVATEESPRIAGRLERVSSSMARHPYMVAGGAGAWMGGTALSAKFNRRSGANASARNQGSIMTRALHRSSGSAGLSGNGSIGGYTGM